MSRGALASLAVVAACAGTGGFREDDVVFVRTTPLSSNAEIARRTLPPLTYRRVQQTLAARGEHLAPQAVDVRRERFDLYVPAGAPPAAGYGLVVFIAPWPDPTRPHQWATALDHHGMIFVSAQSSGNDQPVLDRRLPLALLAYANVRARFAIDPARVYVMGFSGGSRVAEQAALAYPDVFRGAILDAGADPIDGSAHIYKPPAELFRQFEHTRIVVITGDQDLDIEQQDDVALASFRAACVLDVVTDSFHGGHEGLDLDSLDRVLGAVEARHPPDPAELARCNARIERDIATKLAAAAATLARGDRQAVRMQLKAIEAEYGGLAAPGLLELDARL